MNFKPRVISSGLPLTRIKLDKIYCRNFIFTIMVFELFYSSYSNSNNFKPNNFSIHIIKKRKHIGSILRAPYKNKIAQFSIGLYRYFLTLSFSIKTCFVPIIVNKNAFNINIKNLIKSYNYFESTLVTQISRTMLIPVRINII